MAKHSGKLLFLLKVKQFVGNLLLKFLTLAMKTISFMNFFLKKILQCEKMFIAINSSKR